jgi:hypothetical protein
MSMPLSKIVLKFLEFFSIDRERRFAKSRIEKRRLVGESVILVEAWQSPYNQFGISIFLPRLANTSGSRAVSYYAMKSNAFIRTKEFLRHFFSFAKKSGIDKFQLFSLNKSNRHIDLAIDLLNSTKHFDNPLSAFEKLTYQNVEIGDLIYDQYLRMYETPTLNLSDQKLIDLLHDALLYIDKLLKYFEQQRVNAVIVGETTYRLAIPARVAISRGVSAFHVTGSTIYRLNKETKNAYLEAKYFELYANRYLESNFSVNFDDGETFRPSVRSKQDTWTNNPPGHASFQIHRSESKDEIIVLVACHDFFDAPHAYGINLFPDFYHWLSFLGQISSETNYKWFVKPHPAERANSAPIFEELKLLYPRLTILPKETRNEMILKLGVNAVLTVYGTVALEYSQFGIPVINASAVGPYSNWKFCTSPKTLDEYTQVLFQLGSLPKQHSLQKNVAEFLHFEKELLSKSWLFYENPEVLDIVRTTGKGYTWDIFRLFDSKFLARLAELETSLDTFIASGEYFLHKQHLLQS